MPPYSSQLSSRSFCTIAQARSRARLRGFMTGPFHPYRYPLTLCLGRQLVPNAFEAGGNELRLVVGDFHLVVDLRTQGAIGIRATWPHPDVEDGRGHVIGHAFRFALRQLWFLWHWFSLGSTTCG